MFESDATRVFSNLGWSSHCWMGRFSVSRFGQYCATWKSQYSWYCDEWWSSYWVKGNRYVRLIRCCFCCSSNVTFCVKMGGQLCSSFLLQLHILVMNSVSTKEWGILDLLAVFSIGRRQLMDIAKFCGCVHALMRKNRNVYNVYGLAWCKKLELLGRKTKMLF